MRGRVLRKKRFSSPLMGTLSLPHASHATFYGRTNKGTLRCLKVGRV